MLLMLLLSLQPADLNAQFFYGLNQNFGKNRVQFEEFDWVFYRFEGFDVYFYRGNDALAEQVARLTNENLPKIENYLDAPLDERIQILVFNNLSDLKQSNVNSSGEEDYNRSGITRISGRRIFVYFNGSYRDLEDHLRAALSEVVLANLIYGSFTQSITNSALLNLPAWYTEGLISFIGDKWNDQIDRRVRDGFLTESFDKINALTAEEARYAGHSFWYFISETYGDLVIRNILYMSVVNRDIESGFLYILGKDLRDITADWQSFYAGRYDLRTIEKQFEDKEHLIKGRKNHRLVRMAISPDERYLVYVDQRFSRYKIYLYDRQEDKRRRIYTGGYRIAQNTDYSYPHFAWHPNSELLAFFTEEKGENRLNFYNLEKEEVESKPFYRLDKIRSAQYSPDGRDLLLSAVQDGQSDIFIYTVLNTKIQRVTNDEYDDEFPTYFDHGKRIAWASNRKVDSLYPGEDLYVIPERPNDLFATLARPLEQDTLAIWRLTETPGIDEGQLQEYAPGYLSYLRDINGAQAQALLKIDSSIAYVDTTTHYTYNFTAYQGAQYPLNIIDQAHAPRAAKRFDLVLYDGRYRIYEAPYLDPVSDLERFDEAPGAPPEDQGEQATVNKVSENSSTVLYYPAATRRDLPLDITDYHFGEAPQEPASRKRPPEPAKQESPQKSPGKLAEVATDAENTDFKMPNKRNYFLSFFQDDFSVRFDNMFDNRQYQQFTGFVSPNLLNQGFNMNFKVGVMDLMHNYRLIAGMRTTFQPLPGTSLTPNAEFLVAFGDYKDRWDKIYSYRRRSQVQFLSVVNYQRLITNELEAKWIYPFNPVASLRGSLGYRIDENILLARDFNRLGNAIDYTDYGIARLAYVYDNSRKIGLNLYAGLRYKVFTEYYRNIRKSNSGLHTLGVDARHYTVIHRNFIWANRLAAGTSFGPEKLIHIMGGVDNNFSPDSDPSTPIARENNYIFQTLITNMRGFIQNARNGNSFSVLNSELRWPFVSYLANRPIRNDFLNNLMLVGFADVGTAWNGPSPYSRENAINTRTIPLGTGGQIVLDSQKEPILFGTGFGLRSRLFGYYVRADWAWGVEDGIVLPSVFYLSLSTDF